MYKKLVQAFILVSIGLGLSQAYAQEEAVTSTNIYTLGEVVVTAQDDMGVESIGTMHQITDKDIEMGPV